MAFHAYTKPSDFVTCQFLQRSNFVFDADRVGTSTRISFGYLGGEILSTFTATNGTALNGLQTDLGMKAADTPDCWDRFIPGWTVSSNRGVPPAGFLTRIATEATLTANVDITLDVSMVTGSAGIYLRYVSADSFYVGIGPTGVTAFKIQSSIFQSLATGTTPVVAGTMYTLRVVASGNNFSVYLNGALEVSFTDSMNNTSTAHGIWSNGTDPRFDNYTVAARSNVVATSYALRNYDGDILTSGAITPGATYIDIPDSVLTWRGNGPYGWYRLYLTGPDHNDGQWGTAYGDCTFYRVRDDTNFPDNFAKSLSAADTTQGDEYARSVMALGPQRYGLSSTTLATSTASAAGASVLKTNWVDYAYASRPRRTIGAFPNGTAGHETVVTATVNALKASIKAWEPRNEPQGTAAATFVTDEQAPFYAAVKAADPTAIVLGPNPVTFNNASIQWLRDFFTAGGGNYCDGISVHAYNALNGDIQLARTTLTNLLDACTAAGFTGPIYQTEQGYGWAYQGLIYPKYAGRWTALQFFMCELYGIPIENNFYWYDYDQGFDSYPMFWTNSTGPGPQALPVRTMVAEIADRTLDTQFDFGTYGNTIYAGGTWTGTDGTSVVGFMAASEDATDLPLLVTGASSLTCSDAWGNTFAVTVTNGQATFPISELPQWVRCPVGVTVTLGLLHLDTNLAESGTASTTGTAARISRVNDGIQQNEYINSTGLGTSADDPYSDTTGTFPQTITIDLGGVQAAERVVLHCFPPWQSSGTLTDFDIDTSSDGVTWTNRYRQTNRASRFVESGSRRLLESGGRRLLETPVEADTTFSFTSGTRCTLETFWDDRWIFDVAFQSAFITKVRLVINAASYGGHETAASFSTLYSPATPTQNVIVRELQVFGYPDDPYPLTLTQRESNTVSIRERNTVTVRQQ